MNTILFELGTEELPPKSLKTLRDALLANIQKSFLEHQISFGSIHSYAAPRRLAVQILDVATTTPDKTELKKGPSTKAAFDEQGNLTKAGQGFLQGLNAGGLTVCAEDLITISDKKGEYIAYKLHVQGECVDDLLQDIIQKALDDLPIAKRMRSGSDKHEFVRPVQWVVLMRDELVICATIQGHTASNQTRGHRYHAPDFVVIPHADQYEAVLDTHFVVADFDKRRESIKEQVATLSGEVNAAAITPEELLDEVTALVDYPVALRASFEEKFLAVPQEALISTMQADQKYFCLTDTAGKLLPYFIFISNINSKDPKAVILGNEKVVRPRLADAEFFFLQDQKQPLSALADTLKTRIFQDQLGSIWDKTERITALAAFIAQKIHADVALVQRAALLSKCDLASTLVGEFPELQGIAGTYYARLGGEESAVCDAIGEQYLPKFAGDDLPKTDIGVCLALADRLDTLVGIFGIGEIPTGSKDPFSLRRASIGILRILIEQKLALDLAQLVAQAIANYGDILSDHPKIHTQVMEFIAGRYRAMYEDKKVSVDVILAVQAIQPAMPMDFDARIWAVQAFKNHPAAAQLAQNNKRVANILTKAVAVELTEVDTKLLAQQQEQALFAAISDAKNQTAPLLHQADYVGVLTGLTVLDAPLTAFFDQVMVNVDDVALKNNRLALLKQVRDLFLSVADIGLLQI